MRSVSRSLRACFVFAEVVFVSNRMRSVNSNGLSYGRYKHVLLIQGVFEFTKGMFVDILNICL